jgi:uncharacterized iron-regulated membrane protein
MDVHFTIIFCNLFVHVFQLDGWIMWEARKRGHLAIATVKRRKRGAGIFRNQLGNVFKTFGNSRDETFQIEQTE